MFFLWTSEGGPLQYVGVGLFLLQMIPRLFPDMTTMTLLALVVPSSMLMATIHAWQSGALEQTTQQMRQWWNQWQTRLSSSSPLSNNTNNWMGIQWTNVGFSLVVSILVGALVVILVHLDPYWLSVLSQLLALGVVLLVHLDPYWLSVLSQLLALGVVLYTHFYGPDQVAGFPAQGRGVGAAETQSERASRQSKLQRIAQLVQAMPVEPFLPPESIHEHCTISQLKQMLKRRGVTDKELESFVDRQNLEETLVQRRKYSDSCCICFEPFEVGEPLRVLPTCHHELHVECLDKWAFTFASAVKRQHRVLFVKPNCEILVFRHGSCKQTRPPIIDI